MISIGVLYLKWWARQDLNLGRHQFRFLPQGEMLNQATPRAPELVYDYRLNLAICLWLSTCVIKADLQQYLFNPKSSRTTLGSSPA